MGYTVSLLKNGIAETRYGGRMGRTKIENYIVNVWFFSIITTEGSISISRVHILLLLYYRYIEHGSISGSYKSVLYFARIAMLSGTKL